MPTKLLSLFITSLLLITTMLAGCGREGGEQQAQDYVQRANAYREQGQYRAAMIEITNAMNSAPDNVAYPVALAEIYNTLGAGRRASQLLEDYAEEHPQEVALPLAKAYLLQRKFLSAQDVLEAFAPQSEQDRQKQALYEADIQRLKGNLEESTRAYQRLIEAYPDSEQPEFRLAENYLLMNDAEAAEALLATLREKYPRQPEPFHLSALLALQSNNLDLAERRLSEALMHIQGTDIMLPIRSVVLGLLVETLTAQGRTAEALVYQKVLAKESPGSVAAQQRLQEAAAKAEAGEFDDAEAILTELLKDNPDSQSATTMLGMVSLGKGDFQAAEALLTRSVDVETAEADVIRATALAQAESGNAEMALGTLRRSLEARPDNTVLLSLYGVLALEQPELEREGYLSIQKALAQDPQRGALRLLLARYHFQRGEPEQAMGQLRSAFRYQPANWAVTNVYMDRLFSEQALDEIASAVETLKQAAPKAPETTLFEAQYHFRDDRREQAIEQLSDLLKKEPGFARGYGVLAQMFYEQARYRQALDAVEQVVALEPGNEQVLRTGVQIIARGELAPSPHAWLQGLVNKTPEVAPSAVALRAMLYRDEGQIEDAVSLMDRYNGEQTDYVRQVKALVYRDGARQRAENGDLDRAQRLLEKAIQEFPTSKSLNLDLARLEIQRGNIEQARILLDSLKQDFPNDADVMLTSVQATRRASGESAAYQELEAAWQAIISSDKTSSDDIALALLSSAQIVNEDAVPGILERWETVAPQSRARLLFQAEIAQRNGNDDVAVQAYETLLSQNANDPVALNNLAWLLKDGDLTRATALAERAAELQPDSAAILDTYGWLLHLSGDREAALTQLERAADLAPGVEDIQRNLEQVRQSQ
ncbi:tetratricopeptide repeat protein [Marinimicrobium sp. ARAG 43.8]|uniref:tetratricopeptide repeat protein n=1 Tax=Marinimicrobium sp. ARAG 43.8 TaxID=3418719 RepID=UPI003CE7087A